MVWVTTTQFAELVGSDADTVRRNFRKIGLAAKRCPTTGIHLISASKANISAWHKRPLRGRPEVQPPKEYLTVRQWADKMGVSYFIASEAVRSKAIDSKRAGRTAYVVPDNKQNRQKWADYRRKKTSK